VRGMERMGGGISWPKLWRVLASRIIIMMINLEIKKKKKINDDQNQFIPKIK
jgi:hypothetical protein